MDINVPEQDWVVFPNPLTPGSDDTMRITVSRYDTSETEFQLIRLQYRQSNGNGAWINISALPSASTQTGRAKALKSGFVASTRLYPVFWPTTGLADGAYEIRAVAVCTGDASDKPGFSEVIKGRIDREPPKLTGLPEPSDGVYHVGDEISFTFNQEVNCAKLYSNSGAALNFKILLFDATTDDPIAVDFWLLRK